MNEPSSAPSPTPAASGSLHAQMRLAARIVLVGGLLAAALIFAYAATDNSTDAATAWANARLSEFNTERLGGMTTVYIARFNRWLGTLWHGRSLAYTVAALAVGLAAVLYWLSDWVADPAHDEPVPPRPR